jgi:transposase
VCLLDNENGEVIEESRIPTSPKAFERRFSGTAPMRIAIEVGTHSPWVSRLLEECGHEILVANARKECASSMARDARTTSSTP